jgi:hypothetical protein
MKQSSSWSLPFWLRFARNDDSIFIHRALKASRPNSGREAFVFRRRVPEMVLSAARG